MREDSVLKNFMIIGVALALILSATRSNGEETGNTNTSLMDSYLCNFAKVYHLKTGGRLSVRSGPGVQFSKIGSLEAGTTVYICDEQGEWNKVYYGGPNSPCGLTNPKGINVREVKTCKSGWVNRNWIDVLSG
jgi:uncharacterized protein YgiM (DUF1202 family)